MRTIRMENRAATGTRLVTIDPIHGFKADRVTGIRHVWIKVPTSTTGGKQYFFVTDTPHRFWVAWDRFKQKWGVSGEDYKTIAYFDSDKEAREFVELELLQSKRNPGRNPAGGIPLWVWIAGAGLTAGGIYWYYKSKKE